MEQGQVIDLHAQNTQNDDRPFIGNIREDWDYVRDGIGVILRANPSLSYRPEDVYAEVVSGQALYWKTPEGFVISTTEVDPYTGGKTFLVWLAWANEKGNKNVLRYYPFFRQVAAESGYEALEVRTNVSKMETILVNAGWVKDHVVYRLGVQDGQ